ncbi:hypothetical protein AB0L65_52200 [Nonomuraea sp. NPDC052116]|uniref:hypothetical protein n=1 Tax=Nonomuraea sp. NPDC052116 TaxID=3155665 RepID=UPI003425A5CD
MGRGARAVLPALYRLRHAVECGINLCGITICYDKLAVRYEAVVIIAAINQWLNAL